MNQSPHEVVLAFDFSLDRLDISLHAPDDTWPIPHQAYDNNWPGFLTLKQDVLTYLHQHQDSQLTAVGESTGLLWWHAFYHLATDPDLAAYQPRLALLNPAHVKYFRKALPNRIRQTSLTPTSLTATIGSAASSTPTPSTPATYRYANSAGPTAV